jgi:hypothetical protein
MGKEKSVPPKGAARMVKLARLGAYQDEWVDYFRSLYDDKVLKYGEQYARRWAYWHAAKTLFWAAWELGKLAVIIYSRFAGR